MEPARRLRSDDEHEFLPDAPKPRAESEQVSEGIEKVLRFAMPPKSADPGAASRPAGPMTAREFAAAIDLVREAAEAMKVSENRTREAEARNQALAQRASEELKAAEARIAAADARTRAAEARAQESEARAQESDSWLRQIFATISDELPVRRPA